MGAVAAPRPVAISPRLPRALALVLSEGRRGPLSGASAPLVPPATRVSARAAGSTLTSDAARPLAFSPHLILFSPRRCGEAVPSSRDQPCERARFPH